MMKFSRKQALHLLRDNPLVSAGDSDDRLTLELAAAMETPDLVVGDSDIHEKWHLIPPFNEKTVH